MSAVPTPSLDHAAAVLARRVGLRTDPNARGRLSRCLDDGARACETSVDEYVARLETDSAALQDLLDRVTVQETSFFRDPAQFEALAQHVLPQLAEPIAVWSAACANGQEAYSIAMVLDELGYHRSHVIASDVSTQAIDRTRAGVYSVREIGGLSPQRRARYLAPADPQFQIVPELGARIDVVHHNLVTDAPPLARYACPIVFCRNVLIYFSGKEVARFLDRLADWMPAGAWLFLGYSESLWQVSDRFELVRLADAFVYRRREAPRAPRSEVPAAAPQAKRRPPPVRSARRAHNEPAPARRDPVAPCAAVVDGNEPAGTSDDIARLTSEAEAALRAGDHTAAVAAFRKCVYLAPDHPLTHLHLGLALDSAGDATAAARAYAAARAALERSDPATIEATLEGYHADELARFLEAKVGASR